MGKIRHVFPGGNTCQGFFSFYDYLAKTGIKRKIILKGGPGVGKSTFMKKVGKHFEDMGLNIEYHWCSSDNDSLDGVVIGDHRVCLLDGTAPHVVDPKFPGAVDEIINLGQFWKRNLIVQSRPEIISLNSEISHCFNRAYLRLAEAKQALDEWSSFYLQARDEALVNRNILALADEFCRGAERSPEPGRHLFAAAITPRGIESKLDSLLDDSCAFYGVKGSPGSGVKELLSYTAGQLSLRGVYAEIYHNPLVPGDIDIIISPAQRLVMIDVSNSIFDYTSGLANVKFKRWLDFDHLANNSVLNANQGRTEDARQRIQQNLEAAVEYIAQAKETHDQLETHYVPALDFEQVDMYREALQSELRMCLT